MGNSFQLFLADKNKNDAWKSSKDKNDNKLFIANYDM